MLVGVGTTGGIEDTKLSRRSGNQSRPEHPGWWPLHALGRNQRAGALGEKEGPLRGLAASEHPSPRPHLDSAVPRPPHAAHAHYHVPSGGWAVESEGPDRLSDTGHVTYTPQASTVLSEKWVSCPCWLSILKPLIPAHLRHGVPPHTRCTPVPTLPPTPPRPASHPAAPPTRDSAGAGAAPRSQPLSVVTPSRVLPCSIPHPAPVPTAEASGTWAPMDAAVDVTRPRPLTRPHTPPPTRPTLSSVGANGKCTWTASESPRLEPVSSSCCVWGMLPFPTSWTSRFSTDSGGLGGRGELVFIHFPETKMS